MKFTNSTRSRWWCNGWMSQSTLEGGQDVNSPSRRKLQSIWRSLELCGPRTQEGGSVPIRPVARQSGSPPTKQPYRLMHIRSQPTTEETRWPEGRSPWNGSRSRCRSCVPGLLDYDVYELVGYADYLHELSLPSVKARIFSSARAFASSSSLAAPKGGGEFGPRPTCRSPARRSRQIFLGELRIELRPLLAARPAGSSNLIPHLFRDVGSERTHQQHEFLKYFPHGGRRDVLFSQPIAG